MSAALEQPSVYERQLPPVTELTAASLICTLVAGIVVAAQVPNADTLWPAIVLLVAAVGFVAAGLVQLARVRDFAWDTFFQVGKWAVLAYLVIAGMIEFVFIYDDIPARILTMLTLLLVMFAIDVPIMLAFGVARFQEPRTSAARMVPLDDR